MFQNITTDRPLITSVLNLLSNSAASEKDEDESHHEHTDACDHPDDENDSKLPTRTALDSLRICLFCNKELSGVKKCLDHMRQKHSFYILDIDCVTSLKGLLTYIAERIQLGYLCLFCSKMFRNARRCQQHMMDKAHCFMNVDDEHEYQTYYDFSKTYEGHPEAIKLITKKSTSEQSEKSGAKEQNNEWEDVDVESDADEIDVASDEEEDEKKEDESDNGAFSIITDSKEGGSSSAQFQNITGSATSKNIPNDAHIVGEDSLSSIKGGEEGKKRKGMTR